MANNEWRPGSEFIIHSDEEAGLKQLRSDHTMEELDAYLAALLTGDPTAFNIIRAADHTFERLVRSGKHPLAAQHLSNYIKNAYKNHH